MYWLQNHWLQLLFVAGYLLLIAYHAHHGRKQSRSLADYLVGGRRLGGAIIALSFYATFVSSVTFIGHAGRSYTRGPAWWIVCVVVFTSLVFVAWFVVAPPLVKRAGEYGSLTIPAFLGHRYRSQELRRVSGLIVVAASLAYMAAVYDGAARALEGLFEVNSVAIMAVIFLIVTAYTLAGGFHSVVATDAVQGLILFAGAVLLPVAMIWQKGGIGPLLQSAQQIDRAEQAHLILSGLGGQALAPVSGPIAPMAQLSVAARIGESGGAALQWIGDMSLFTMVGLALGVGLKFVVEPRQLSRFYGLASHDQLRRGRWIAPALLFLTYLFMLPVGFLAHAFIFPSEGFKGDQVVPHLLGPQVNVLGTIGGALFLTALAAAAMSSLDSVLLVAASSADHDVFAPNRDPGKAMLATRIWVVILSAVAGFLALRRERGIVEMSSFSGSIYAAAFLPTLVIGLFWQRATKAGAFACLMLGFPVTVFWFYWKKYGGGWEWIHEVHEVYVGVGVALLSFVVVSLLTSKRE